MWIGSPPLPNPPCQARLCVGLVSSPSFISLRQMSQASTGEEGSTTIAFSRPRPRTCRQAGGKGRSSTRGTRTVEDPLQLRSAGRTPAPAGRQAGRQSWPLVRPPALYSAQTLHHPVPPPPPLTHLLDEWAACVHDCLAEDGAQPRSILSALLFNQHLQGQGRPGGWPGGVGSELAGWLAGLLLAGCPHQQSITRQGSKARSWGICPRTWPSLAKAGNTDGPSSG